MAQRTLVIIATLLFRVHHQGRWGGNVLCVREKHVNMISCVTRNVNGSGDMFPHMSRKKEHFCA